MKLKRRTPQKSKQKEWIRPRWAIHEAGHAVAAYLLKIKFTEVAINSNGGHLEMVPRREIRLYLYDAYQKACVKMILSGQVAEFLYDGRALKNKGYHSDDEAAARIIREICSSKKDREELLWKLWRDTFAMLESTARRTAIYCLANALLENGKLTKTEALKIIRASLKHASEPPKFDKLIAARETFEATVKQLQPVKAA